MYVDVIHCYNDNERSLLIEKMHEDYQEKTEIIRKLWFSTMHNYLHGFITREEYHSAMSEIESTRRC
jgi:hypothetical protein